MSSLVPDLPLGAHQSIAGGAPRAVERALAAGCRVLKIFVKNNRGWTSKEIAATEARQFRSAARQAALTPIVAHTSYLINLASPVQALRRQSIEALADEIARCELLGTSCRFPSSWRPPRTRRFDLDRKNLAVLRRLAV